MRRTQSSASKVIRLVFGALLLTLLAVPAGAASISNGNTIYTTICSACHGSSAAANVYNIKAGANNPTLIQSLINTNFGGMGVLKNQLTSTQISDAAAYLGSVFYPNQGAPGIGISPPSIVFAARQVGTSGSGTTVTVSNTGTGTLIISGVTVSSGDFGIFSGCGASIAPGTSCFITLTFAPKTAGIITGNLTVSSNASPASYQIALSGTGTSSTPAQLGPRGDGIVVEYWLESNNTYFITASGAEQAFVDGGGAGPWQATGNWFKSGGSNAVCRFYGNQALGTNGKPLGPNSHFYTGDSAECAQVKLDPGWKFESLDFQSTPPVAGACAASLAPVYRAYNNGYLNTPNNSNHRITSNKATYDQQVASGWTGEGIVMCAPQ